MVNLNLTLPVELALFLIFLWVANRIAFRPLLRTMDARTAKLEEEKAAANSDSNETKRLNAQYIEKLTAANQLATQQLNKARSEAYRENRLLMDDLKEQAATEVATYRDAIDSTIAEERLKYPNLVSSLAVHIGGQIDSEGSIL